MWLIWAISSFNALITVSFGAGNKEGLRRPPRRSSSARTCWYAWLTPSAWSMVISGGEEQIRCPRQQGQDSGPAAGLTRIGIVFGQRCLVMILARHFIPAFQPGSKDFATKAGVA